MKPNSAEIVKDKDIVPSVCCTKAVASTHTTQSYKHKGNKILKQKKPRKKPRKTLLKKPRKTLLRKQRKMLLRIKRKKLKKSSQTMVR